MIEAKEITTSLGVKLFQTSELEQTMLSEDKLYVVLAVVLVIWFGIVIMLMRNDRKISQLESQMADNRKEDQGT